MGREQKARKCEPASKEILFRASFPWRSEAVIVELFSVGVWSCPFLLTGENGIGLHVGSVSFTLLLLSMAFVR